MYCSYSRHNQSAFRRAYYVHKHHKVNDRRIMDMQATAPPFVCNICGDRCVYVHGRCATSTLKIKHCVLGSAVSRLSKAHEGIGITYTPKQRQRVKTIKGTYEKYCGLITFQFNGT